MQRIKLFLGWLATVLALLAMLGLALSHGTIYAFKLSIEVQIVMGIAIVGLLGGYLLNNKAIMTIYAIGFMIGTMFWLII